jgi:serine O-acetyltransferase
MEIHCNAQIDPGVSIVHGLGLVISHASHVKSGCILSQNVTLGEARDLKTKKKGAPTLENNVHIGPGATILGPVTIGANSKIMAGAVVTESVPPFSIVKAPVSEILPRK